MIVTGASVEALTGKLMVLATEVKDRQVNRMCLSRIPSYMGISFQWFIMVALAGFFGSGCAMTTDVVTMEKEVHDSVRIPNSTPQLSLFLHPDQDQGPKLSVTISAIEFFDGQQWVSVIDTPFVYDSVEQKNGQVIVARIALQQTNYSKIRVTVKGAELLDREGVRQTLGINEPVLSIDFLSSLKLEQTDRRSLFLVLDRQASLSADGQVLTPQFRFYVQDIPLTSELAFVSCPEIDTIYVIRTDTNRVVGSWSVSGKPTYLQAFKSSDELYVLAEKEKAIKMYELSSGRLKDSITIPLIFRPGSMVINPAKTSAYVVDADGDFVYRIDLASSRLVTRARIGQKLDFALYLTEQQRLAVSSRLSQKVFILDPTTLGIVDIVSSVSSPDGMCVYNDKLYVAESMGNSVLAYNLATGSTVRKSLGMFPTRIIESGGYLFVANTHGGTISVLLPDQLSIVKEIRSVGNPVEMASSTNRRWLYNLDIGKGGVNVVDLTSYKNQAYIDLDSVPFDVEIIN